MLTIALSSSHAATPFDLLGTTYCTSFNVSDCFNDYDAVLILWPRWITRWRFHPRASTTQISFFLAPMKLCLRLTQRCLFSTFLFNVLPKPSSWLFDPLACSTSLFRVARSKLFWRPPTCDNLFWWPTRPNLLYIPIIYYRMSRWSLNVGPICFKPPLVPPTQLWPCVIACGHVLIYRLFLCGWADLDGRSSLLWCCASRPIHGWAVVAFRLLGGGCYQLLVGCWSTTRMVRLVSHPRPPPNFFVIFFSFKKNIFIFIFFTSLFL